MSTGSAVPSLARRAQGSPRSTFGFSLRAEETPMLDKLLASYPASTSVSAMIRALVYDAAARLEADETK